MLDEPIGLDQAYAHLKRDPDGGEQDAYIEDILIPAARRYIENDIGLTIVGDEPTLKPADAEIIVQTMLLLVGHWFVNRESADVPAGIAALLWPLKTVRV